MLMNASWAFGKGSAFFSSDAHIEKLALSQKHIYNTIILSCVSSHLFSFWPSLWSLLLDYHKLKLFLPQPQLAFPGFRQLPRRPLLAYCAVTQLLVLGNKAYRLVNLHLTKFRFKFIIRRIQHPIVSPHLGFTSSHRSAPVPVPGPRYGAQIQDLPSVHASEKTYILVHLMPPQAPAWAHVLHIRTRWIAFIRCLAAKLERPTSCEVWRLELANGQL